MIEIDGMTKEGLYVSMEKEQLILMMQFPVKREEDRAQESQKLQDMVRPEGYS